MLLAPRLFFHLSGIVFSWLHLEAEKKNQVNPVHPVKQLEAGMYYSYVLQSEKDNGFYIGFTKDLKLRPALLNNASH